MQIGIFSRARVPAIIATGTLVLVYVLLPSPTNVDCMARNGLTGYEGWGRRSCEQVQALRAILHWWPISLLGFGSAFVLLVRRDWPGFLARRGSLGALSADLPASTRRQLEEAWAAHALDREGSARVDPRPIEGRFGQVGVDGSVQWVIFRPAAAPHGARISVRATPLLPLVVTLTAGTWSTVIHGPSGIVDEVLGVPSGDVLVQVRALVSGAEAAGVRVELTVADQPIAGPHAA